MALAWLSLLAAGAAAQEERPQITPPPVKPGERKIGGKEVGPRALALLQLGANGKSSLVPIAIMVNGKFWDAAAYKANPVPMALDSGTVYEVEKAGSSQGLFTVSAALHSNSANVPNPWIGTGLWLPAGTEGPKTGMKAEAVPVGLETSDGPPRLSKSTSTPKGTPPASSAPAATPSGSSSAPAPASTSGSSSSGTSTGTSPGTSTGSASTGAGSAAPASAPSAPADSKPADAKPSESKPADTKPAESKPPAPNVPASDSGAGGGARPRLRRGKPTEPLPEDDIPGYSKPGATPAATDGKAASAPSSTAAVSQPAGPVQLIPAISDTTGPEPRSYTYEWLKGEESDRLKQMTDLAKAEVRAYIDARAKAKINTPAQAAEAARRKRAGKPPQPVLENVQMTAYDLWTNGQPVMVFSAAAHVPPPGATNGVAGSDLQYSIMLVAHPDLYNNLSKLYIGITDQFHLDITPRLDLIDVVDADGDGRGELLFHETSDAGTGYVIYRVTADKLWKMFDSLNAE